MNIYTEALISSKIIELFQSKIYEIIVYEMISSSKIVFPESYKYNQDQSHGECEYEGLLSKEKYDAKLPFHDYQMELLSTKKHEAKIQEWLVQLKNEAEEFSPVKIRELIYSSSQQTYEAEEIISLRMQEAIYSFISSTQLYQIMKRQLKKDKIDEHLIFFIPYPIVTYFPDERSVINQTSNYLTCIYDTLNSEKVLFDRNIYVILPSTEKNVWTLIDLKNRKIEFVHCDKTEPYLSYSNF